MELESLILQNLTRDEQFVRTALPYLHSDYFKLDHHRKIFEIIKGYAEKYNRPPNVNALMVEVQELPALTQDGFNLIQTEIANWSDEKSEFQWLVDTTENWCQDRSLANALSEAIEIASDGDKGISRGAIPEILTNALSVSFNSSIGVRYLGDADSRYENYHSEVIKFPTKLARLNGYMGGGPEAGSLNVLMASTGVGKSIWLCDFAGDYMLKGYNVLYITAEMSEHKITERIDANLLDVEISKVKKLSKSRFDDLIGSIINTTTGELVVQQYPTGTGHTGHFRHLLNELKLKKNFKPDVILVDYINICASARLHRGKSSSYEYVKAISEELRGLAVEANVPMWSATQSNRGAANSSSVGIDDVGESWGLPQTADFLGVIISDEELKASGQQIFKILKNRYGPADKSFMVGIDYEKMRIFDLEDSHGHVEEEVPTSAYSDEPINRFEHFQFDN